MPDGMERRAGKGFMIMHELMYVCMSPVLGYGEHTTSKSDFSFSFSSDKSGDRQSSMIVVCVL